MAGIVCFKQKVCNFAADFYIYIVKDEDNQMFWNMPARHFGLCRV